LVSAKNSFDELQSRISEQEKGLVEYKLYVAERWRHPVG